MPDNTELHKGNKLIENLKARMHKALYISDKRNIIRALEGMSMDYMTTKEAAAKWGVTDRMVLYHCTSGRIAGAVKMGNTWLIPKDAVKPPDKRYRRTNHAD